ncbi:putative bifunctional diguanylate cyclase/phosphodiesterase [Gymnodinialimonas ulvae]|uniref:putative bifunctional diguanylate cyclase/phosphodiesterase n=1 Tax=Gymnodinialimonas ulvae TaxID=3126504 RepID=UPI0030A4A8E5
MKHVDEIHLSDNDNLLEVVSKLQLAVAASRMGVWEYDERTNSVHWDDRMLEIYGITDGLNNRPDDFWERHIHPDDVTDMVAYADKCRRENRDFQHDYRIIREDGAVRHIRSLARTLTVPGGKSRLVGVNIDVTDDYLRSEELRKAQAQLKHDARHDALTRLGNRRALDEAMIDAFALMTERDQFCLILLDLDHFKEVNDSLGHLAGDFILSNVGEILRSTLDALACPAPRGTAFRAGGDEFAIFFPTAPAQDDLDALCEALVFRIGSPMEFEGEECFVGASIGYAIGTGPPDNPSAVFAEADTALYEVKRNGRSGYRAYSDSLASKPADATNVRRDLLNALTNDEFVCWYQPQFDAQSLGVVGAEALVRWMCPQRGLLSPAAFLGDASDLKLLDEIDNRVLHMVASQQNRWRADGIDYPTIAVNTSAERLARPEFIDTIRLVLGPQHKVAVELLETSFIDKVDATTTANLDALRELGIRIDLDDFGSGHSSVIALQALKPHIAKIDRSLVLPLEENPRQIMTLRALCRIARLEGARTVIEGLENGMLLAATRYLDCDVLQGYALQRPMPASDFSALLRRSGAAPEGR